MGSAFGYSPGLDSARVDYRIAHVRYCRDSGWKNKNINCQQIARIVNTYIV